MKIKLSQVTAVYSVSLLSSDLQKRIVSDRVTFIYAMNLVPLRRSSLELGPMTLT